MGPTPLLLPPASLKTHHKNTSTVSSKESFASETITPGIKLKSKFQDIQLSLSNKEQIYETLLKLDHVERGEYKVDKLYSVYDIWAWIIFKSDAIDCDTQYIIKLNLNDANIVVDVKWNTDITLFNEILELLHGLSLKLRFIIDSEYLTQRKENINEYLKQLEYGNDLLFHWDVIRFEFTSEINMQSTGSCIIYYSNMFKQILKIDWHIIFQNLIWQNPYIFSIISRSMVICIFTLLNSFNF